MALSADTSLIQELGPMNAYLILAATLIYEGAAVGLEAGSGQARGLVNGDLFLGFAESQADNREDAVGGALSVRVIQHGKVEVAISGLAATDIGAAVYATADDTFVLTSGSFVGYVSRFVSSGVGVIAYDAIMVQAASLGS